MNMPPHINADDKVVLFDGVCKLCTGWSNFLLKHDKRGVFKLCTVQSQEGKEILEYFGFATDVYESMLYIEGNTTYTKSGAFLKIIHQLPRPYCYLYLLRIIPEGLRNWAYDRIALNRYRLFGKYPACAVPSPSNLARFINQE